MATVTVPSDEAAAAAAEAGAGADVGTARSEQRLGWRLVAPAVVVMLAVTAYPMGRAVYLSLYSYRLTDPAGRSSSACATTASC